MNSDIIAKIPYRNLVNKMRHFMLPAKKKSFFDEFSIEWSGFHYRVVRRDNANIKLFDNASNNTKQK
jgi:hypothetical protein